MKYIKQFDNYFDTSAYANEIIEKPLVLLNTGGGMTINYSFLTVN